MNTVVESASPILEWQADITRTPFALALERQEELQPRVSHMHVVFSSDRRDITVVPATGEITLGVAALEQLWASAYWYYVFYDEYGEAQRRRDTSLNYESRPPHGRRFRAAELDVEEAGGTNTRPMAGALSQASA